MCICSLGVDRFRMHKLGEKIEITRTTVVFDDRELESIRKDCEIELVKTMLAAGMEPFSGYVLFLKGPVLRIIFEVALSEMETLELFLRYFITISALSSAATANVHNVMEDLRLHLDCYMRQLMRIYLANHPVLAPGIVTQETIELINSISQGDSSHNPKFWY